MRRKTGFTLIELLVTISMLSVLSAIAIVVYSGVTAKTRDSQKIRDLQSIKQALELYRSDVHNYPASLVLTGGINLTNVDGSVTYLSPIPEDKDLSRHYYYSALHGTSACTNTSEATACTNFILCAKREGTSADNDLNACNALPSGSCGSGVSCDIGISSQ